LLIIFKFVRTLSLLTNSTKTLCSMTTFLKKAVDKMYILLFPDAVGEFSATFKYKLLIVVLVLVMFSSAAFTMAFFQT